MSNNYSRQDENTSTEAKEVVAGKISSYGLIREKINSLFL